MNSYRILIPVVLFAAPLYSMEQNKSILQKDTFEISERSLETIKQEMKTKKGSPEAINLRMGAMVISALLANEENGYLEEARKQYDLLKKDKNTPGKDKIKELAFGLADDFSDGEEELNKKDIYRYFQRKTAYRNTNQAKVDELNRQHAATLQANNGVEQKILGLTKEIETLELEKAKNIKEMSSIGKEADIISTINERLNDRRLANKIELKEKIKILTNTKKQTEDTLEVFKKELKDHHDGKKHLTTKELVTLTKKIETNEKSIKELNEKITTFSETHARMKRKLGKEKYGWGYYVPSMPNPLDYIDEYMPNLPSMNPLDYLGMGKEEKKDGMSFVNVKKDGQK